MRSTFSSVGILVALGSLASGAWAHEGMWMPEQLQQIAGELQAAGLDLDPQSLARLTEFPLGAIVGLSGCTGSFVSPQGLVVTNYHCVYSSIQYHSTADRDLIHDGFLARARSEEVAATPGSRALVTVDSQDITPRLLDADTSALAGEKRVAAIEAIEKTIIADCEKDVGYRCSVNSFYGGLQYFLVKQLEIRDLRLVYAPPDGVGMFGGETDNWMWPRHTGDFGFYRAYVGIDGRPAEYSPDNVPYQPKHHLTVAAKGVDAGDFVMVIGYPKRTSRYALPAEIESTFDWNYPALNKASNEQLQIISRETRDREPARLAYANRVAAINNGAKKRQGLLESYARSDLLTRKQLELTAFKAWVRANPERLRLYGSDLEKIEHLIAKREANSRRDFLLDYAQPRFLITARGLYQLANERAKADDIARKPGFQERDLPEIKEALSVIDKRYDEQVDKALALNFLLQYLRLPSEDQSRAFNNALGLRIGMTESDLRAQIDRVYAGSRLADRATRLAWVDRDVAAFKRSDDSLIKAAVALYPDDMSRERRDRQMSGQVQRAYANYMKAFIAYKKSNAQSVYPDANGTLRVTYGKVDGRQTGNNDGTAWNAFTTLRGIVAKNTREGEFEAPAAQLTAIADKSFGAYSVKALDSVPVNYLSTLDITGGNSGSPVLNSRAELVGLVFDGTLDSVMSDWDFDSASTRAISVDVRYMLWQMQIVDHAGHLLAEMGLQ